MSPKPITPKQYLEAIKLIEEGFDNITNQIQILQKLLAALKHHNIKG